ncbi:MAG: hypothetical protein Q8L53_01485 [Aestuariivirga sp.]|nr:hypothetical protein [Aestuariivirga sp.]
MTLDRRILIGLAVAFTVAGIFAYLNFWHPTVTLRYRLTLEAMTPDGPKTGSGVIQVSYGSTFNLDGGGRRGVMKVTGEAVPVDLGRGNVLFVTLTNYISGRNHSFGKLDGAANAETLPLVVFGFKWNVGDEYQLPPQIAAAQASGPREVPFRSLPTLVKFEDVNNPKSVGLVQPERLSAAFGEGYALSKVTMEIKNDPPSEGIAKLLNWLPKLIENRLRLNGEKGPVTDNALSNNLGAGEFKRNDQF